MSMVDTVQTLLELAIAAEQKNLVFYQGLSKIFSHLPEVTYFWQDMAMDEVQHTQKLKNIRISLKAKQLRTPANDNALEQARKALKFLDSESMNSILILDDAYRIARTLERSEVNTVFSFIMNEFIPSEKQKEFILWQLENHTQKMVKFPEIFGDAESRKKILAKSFIGKSEAVDFLQSETNASVF